MNLYGYANNNSVNSIDPFGLFCSGPITDIEGEWGEWRIKPTDITYGWENKQKITWDKVQPKGQAGSLLIHVTGEAKASVDCSGCCEGERIHWTTSATVYGKATTKVPVKKGILPPRIALLLKGLFMSDYIGHSSMYKALNKCENEIRNAINTLGDAATYCKLSANGSGN